MGWSIGGPDQWDRFVGYGVPAYCDHPGCTKKIDRGLAHVCGEEQPYGGEHGCGLYFCSTHHDSRGFCARCAPYVCWDDDEDEVEGTPERPKKWAPFDPKPEHPQWMRHMLRDSSWAEWRAGNPEKVKAFEAALKAA